MYATYIWNHNNNKKRSHIILRVREDMQGLREETQKDVYQEELNQWYTHASLEQGIHIS